MPVKIFFCYAHEDEALLNQLKTQLRPLQLQDLIDIWHDRNINAGSEWRKEINEHLNKAKIILLLVSPDFMNSDYCYGVEMKRAIERHKAKEARVIPIILRPVYWHEAPFSKLQALPTNAIPVTDPSWHNLDRAFLNVVLGIRKVVKEEDAKLEKAALPKKSTSLVDQTLPLPVPQNKTDDARSQASLPADNEASNTPIKPKEQLLKPLKPAGNIDRKSLPSKRLIFASLIAFVVLLVGSGILYAFSIPGSSKVHRSSPLSASVAMVSAIVKITPAKTYLKKTYNILAVTGTPDASQHQVQARLLSNRQVQTQTTKATGVIKTRATQAKGAFSVTNNCSTPLTLTAGQDFFVTGININGDPKKPLLAMVATTITIPIGNSATVPAYANLAGSIGNQIKKGRYTGSIMPIQVDLNTPFSGGLDAQNYTFVKQSDIDNAANALKATNPPDPQQVLQPQIQANERFIGDSHCNPNVTSDHAVGDKVTSVTVTVTFICTGEVYDQQAALSMAAGLLKNDAISDLNASYTLTGKISPVVLQVNGVDANGTVSLLVQAEATGIFQFSDAYKQTLAQLISGRSEQDAQQLLLREVGVSKVAITFSSGSGQTLPIKPSSIKITVVGE